MVKSPENCAKCKKSVLKAYILYGRVYITFLKWHKCRNGERLVVDRSMEWVCVEGVGETGEK